MGESGAERGFSQIKLGRDTLVALILAVGGWRTGLAKLGDNSFFCHLQTGLWIVHHGVPHKDPFSFTAAGAPWIAESWLADLLYGVLDLDFGPFAILILNAATGSAIAALWYFLALRLCRDRLRTLVLTLLSLGAAWTLWAPRPLLLGVLAFLVLAWIVECPESFVGRHSLLVIPPLMWLWANIHGSFTLGFAYLALHVIGRWLTGSPPWRGRERQLAAGIVVGFGFCLLNPYGVNLLLAPLHLMGRRELLSHVIEWRPPTADVHGAMYLAWLIAFATCMIVGRSRWSVTDLLVCIPFLAAGLVAERNIAIAPLVTMPIAARAIASEQSPSSADLPIVNWALAGLMIVLVIGWTVQAATTPRFDFDSYPVRAMETIEAKGLLGKRLLNDDFWGGYIILRYWPRQLVFVDDRYDMYPFGVLRDLVALRDGSADWSAILARYRIEVVIWRRGAGAERALNSAPGWRRVYDDRKAVVFAHSQEKEAR